MKAHKTKQTCAHCGSEYHKRADRVLENDACSAECRKAYLLSKKQRNCLICGSAFYPRPGQTSIGQGKYCSMPCVHKGSIGRKWTEPQREKLLKALRNMKHPSGEANKLWKGRYIVDGYVWRNIGGRRFAEHRLLAEWFLQRKLASNEVVHHINEIRSDNRIENLMVLSPSEHTKIHHAGRRPGKPMYGEANPAAKLSAERVREIRSSTETPKVLAQKFSVTASLISMVRKRQIWAHVEP